MLFKKNILFLFSILLFFVKISSAKDEITEAIINKDHKKIAYIINNYKNLDKKKKEYLDLIGNDLQKQDYLSFKLKKDNICSALKFLSYLGLSGTSLYAAKEAFYKNESYKKTALLLSGAAIFLGFQGCNEFLGIFNNSKDISDYYKTLAIREELLKI